MPAYYPQAAPLSGYGDIKIGTFVCIYWFYTELVLSAICCWRQLEVSGAIGGIAVSAGGRLSGDMHRSLSHRKGVF